jgi:hypothetical protein
VARKSALVSLAEVARDVAAPEQLTDFVIIIRGANGEQLLTVSLLLHRAASAFCAVNARR